MRNIKHILCIITLCFPLFGAAQRTAVGRWQDHYSYNRVFAIVVMNNEISAATENGLFFYDKNENSVRKFTTVHGLSQVGLTASNYDSYTNTQIIGYENGNIDLIQNDQVFNIPDLQRWQTSGSKRINKIVIQNSQKVYLCCDFGIVVLNLNKREISETYWLGANSTALKINDLALNFTDSLIYAATEQGLYSANLNSKRLSNPAEWTEIQLDTSFGLAVKTVCFWNENLLANASGDTVFDYKTFRFDQTQWHLLDTAMTTQFKIRENRLFQIRRKPDSTVLWEICEYDSGFRFSSKTSHFDFWGLEDFEFDREGNIWLSTGFYGLEKLTPDWQWDSHFQPSGPATNSVYALSHSQSKLYSANGSASAGWGLNWQNFGVDILENGNWWAFDYRNLSQWLADAVSVAENPSNPDMFAVASFQGGVVLRHADGTNTVYNQSNSTLEAYFDGWNNVISCGDVRFDKENQLWATTAKVPHHVHRRTPAGEWTAFDLGYLLGNEHYTKDFIIDYHNTLWIRTMEKDNAQQQNLLLFKEANNALGFEALMANLNNGNDQKINKLHCLVEDLKGYIWLGTDRGILVNRTSQQLFKDPIGNTSKVTFETIIHEGRPLLENENVTAIAVDGADRKWIGTSSSGVFLMSADGKEKIHQFNTQNSPLNSNSISALAVNPKTGDVFIGTDRGLMSFGGNATLAGTKKQKIVIYPNPVRADFQGDIGIQGLADGAHVRITDASGTLIFETVANGGMATWNGKTRNGQRVNPGVYVVFSTDATNEQSGTITHVGKIFFSK